MTTNQVTVGASSYTLHSVARGSVWVAYARAVTGDRFGIECTASTETEANERMIAWLEWQHAHATALMALQAAERAYHRMVAGQGFTPNAAADPATSDSRHTLDEVEAARARLDEIRARKPDGA